MSGGTRVTLFAITEPGLFQLTVAGSGAYDLELGIAGDVNADGKVDGADGAAVAAALEGSDISGDGLVDDVDRQLVAQNYGFPAYLAPLLAEELPDVFTHVDLSPWLQRASLATAPYATRVS